MPEGPFDKDFGYLMPFLDKIAGAASGLADQAARAELSSLIAGEKQRWERIRQLLGGAGGRASAASAPAPKPAASETASPAETREVPSFTVGSLRTKSR